jgi:transcriptional accessory protein Tex/SPT6
MIRAEHLDIPMVTMYRKYEFQKELDESDVWTIFNLDIEYGKYMHEKQQIKKFLAQIS